MKDFSQGDIIRIEGFKKQLFIIVSKNAFIKAMNKGLVGPEGESGIKYFNGKINGILYEFEIKVKNSEFGNFRIFGNYNESLDEIIFDFFTKGQGKKHR